jgi:hypothetical protein
MVLKIPITFCPYSQFALRAAHLVTHDRVVKPLGFNGAAAAPLSCVRLTAQLP